MLRRSFALVVVCALAGCQDYNFNPVGKCVIQPGSSRIQLSSLATADLLFVVDDSGSMAAEQANLARNFSSFIAALQAQQAERAASGLEPFEFHVAITTSAVFEGWLPVTGSATCGGSPLACGITRSRYTNVPPNPPLLCAAGDDGKACDDLVQNYFPIFTGDTACLAGVATPGSPYPHGDFVHAAANPPVLHFTKDVWASTADGAAKLAALQQQFQANINVGTCGSGMEQHFEAGRLAVEKALAGTQPNVKAGEFPHAGAKLVVVWVGDEDDCSNPNDPTKALAFDINDLAGTQSPGADVCIADETSATPKQFPLDRYASYFTGLGRSFGAAFVYSSDPTSCKDELDSNSQPTGNRICTPGRCNCVCPASCGGVCNLAQPPGPCQFDPNQCSGKTPSLPVPGHSRFGQLSALFRAQKVNTFEASVCDADWGSTLQGIAKLVRPPTSLSLPTQPAATDVALLRIESADGKTSRYCNGPAASQAELDANTADWEFVDCKTGAGVFGPTTACIDINHASGHCEPNAGESYVAQYLGIVPSPTAANPTGGCLTNAPDGSAECAALMEQNYASLSSDAKLQANTRWACIKPSIQAVGSCACR